MGIPYLLKRLQSYSVSRYLGCDSIDCECHKLNTTVKDPKIIVDGPCLSYFVYHRLLAHKPAILGPIDAQPSYNDIGRGVIALLNRLQSVGLQISKIYFDGYLPDEKIHIREARVDQKLQNLISFRSKHPKGFDLNIEAARGNDDATMPLNKLCSKILTPRTTPKNLFGNSPASFINAAVLECLLQSAYATVTKVVPGEADHYCARRAAQEGGIILTSDSDLLVHDLGRNGSVVFIDQLELKASKSTSGCTVNCISIQVNVFEPYHIVHELGIPDMIGLAYFMSKDPSMEVKQVVRSRVLPRADNFQTMSGKEFSEFVAHYRVMPNSQYSDFDPQSLAYFKVNGSILDPRLSELVLQFAKNECQILTMFLWPIVEDPSRVSAWAASSDIRTYAYAYLQYWHTSATPESRILQEYTRRGHRYVHQTVDVHGNFHGNMGITGYAAYLNDLYHVITNRFTLQSKMLIWRLLVLSLVLKWNEDEGRNPPTIQNVENAMTGQAGFFWSWEDLHLTAQINAALYSLRMVKQALCYTRTKGSGCLFDDPVRRLHDILSDLPDLKVLITTRLELKANAVELSGVDWSRHVATLVQINGDRS